MAILCPFQQDKSLSMVKLEAAITQRERQLATLSFNGSSTDTDRWSEDWRFKNG